MNRIHCVLALGCLLVTSTLGKAQPPQPTTNPNQRPGVQAGDRFLGYEPKHEKVLRQRSIPLQSLTTPPTTALERQTRPGRSQVDSPIQQASYEMGYEQIGPPSMLPTLGAPCTCDGPCTSMRCKVPRIWGGAEFLYMWTSGAETPALATISPVNTAQTDAGVLPNATTLFGGDDLHDSMPGGRFSLGIWLNPESTVGVEFSYLFLADDEASFSAAQNEFAILGRPFFNVDLSEEDARLISFDSLVDGRLSINASSEFETFEVFLRRLLLQRSTGRSELLFGYRRANLEDLIRMEEFTTALSGPAIDSTFDLFDQFQTENEFHGGLIGIDYIGPTIRCWSLGILAKVAIGYNTSRVAITGETTTSIDDGDATTPVDVSTTSGGLLTQASNVGFEKDDKFSTFSEFGISLNRRWECGLGVNFGYRFLHWSEVARAAEQIDRNINPTQIPPGTLSGAARPENRLNRSDFWAQGLTAGLEYRF